VSRLLEDAAKHLLATVGLAVPRGAVAATPVAAADVAASLGGPVVVKALVPVGGKGLAGAVRVAATPGAAQAAAAALLGVTVRQFPVERVLVEERVAIERELYAAVVLDGAAVALASATGGVAVETLAARPGGLSRQPVDPWRGLAAYQARRLWAEQGLSGPALRLAGEALARIGQAFTRYEATLVEVNPLALTADGRAVAVGALMAVDDDALFRQPALTGLAEAGNERAWRPLTALERQALAVDAAEPYRGTARYTEFDGGDIACLCGGGGASLLLMDALRRAGGQPANYSEFGGNPSADKVAGLARVALSKPGVRGLFVCQNITSNTQVDLSAEGVLRALAERGLTGGSFPVVMRLAGVGEDRARELCAAAGVEYHADDLTLEQAAARMVAVMRAES
jgi:succinyl-CoA synthetase beta subunit/citryl-CoA synthetase large subunit